MSLNRKLSMIIQNSSSRRFIAWLPNYHAVVLTFCIWIDDLLSKCSSNDVVELQRSKFVNKICDRIQCALDCIENWCICVTVNADKTSMVLLKT
jgi:hypothetical protein